MVRRFLHHRRLAVTPASRLQATLDLLQEIDSVARPADAVVSAWFRARRYIGDRDRGPISELLYALLRHHARLRWWLEKHGREATPRNRLLALLALVQGRSRDQIKELFNGGQYAPPALTDQERTLLAKLKGLRGTALDVFGYSAERRTERALIDQYRKGIEDMLSSLSDQSRDRAMAMARWPEQIKGFGHVKERHLAQEQANWRQLTQSAGPLV